MLSVQDINIQGDVNVASSWGCLGLCPVGVLVKQRGRISPWMEGCGPVILFMCEMNQKGRSSLAASAGAGGVGVGKPPGAAWGAP